jgi:predicted metal-dependent peptidase
MASRIRPSVDKNLMDKEFVPVEDKTQCLATAIYETSKTHPFMGSVLQCLTIAYSHTLPTAGILFNTDAKRWDMLVNPFFFCKKLSAAERKAVLIHELSHITHKHPLRVPFMKISAHKRQLMNVAADMAINQFIKDLPRGCQQCPPKDSGQPCKNEMCPGNCIDVNDYSDEDPKNAKVKIPWPKNVTMESYYEKLIRRFDDPNEGEDGTQQGVGSGSGPAKGQGKKGNAGGGAESGDIPQTLDEHLWDGAADEKEMLDATEELVKRAMVKARLSYDDIPGHVKELLDDIKARRAELNYKALIMAAMKKHASGHDRKHTWTRKSKRFGYKSPGTKVGELPELLNVIDTSGSISIEEANDFLEIVDQFLRVGARKCQLCMFHTSLYYNEKYKLGKKMLREDFQSGGTDLTEVMQEVLRRRPDLTIVLTDGCYSDVAVESWMKPGEVFPQMLWIISKGGTVDHPLKRFGETIKIPDTGSRGNR